MSVPATPRRATYDAIALVLAFLMVDCAVIFAVLAGWVALEARVGLPYWELVPPLVPGTLPQLIRHVLHERRHHVDAGGCERVVDVRRRDRPRRALHARRLGAQLRVSGAQ